MARIYDEDPPEIKNDEGTAHYILDNLGVPEVESRDFAGLIKRLRKISAVMIYTDRDIEETQIFHLNKIKGS